MNSILVDWIKIAKDQGASDLHIEAGIPLVLRTKRHLQQTEIVAQPLQLQSVIKSLLSEQGAQDFEFQKSADLSRTIAGVRCRINIYRTVRGPALSIRLLSSFQNNLRDSNLHPDLKQFLNKETGLIILSGPTGSGKSTTLAALIEEINISTKNQIISLESPIEYHFLNKGSYIRQREVPTHSPSYEQGITDAMREDPDVLIIGEMRTPETMRLTLQAAETGHLVITTMHSATCAEALSRICQSFAAEFQNGMRAALADCLVGVVCQRLISLPKYGILAPQCEILTASTSVKASIRAGQFSQLASAIQTGAQDGMWSYERYQKWMDQKTDWVKPSHAKPLPSETIEPLHQIPIERTFVSVKKPPSAPQTKLPSDPDRIEISEVDEDLGELGRKVVETSKDE